MCYFATITVKTSSGKIHEWMMNPGDVWVRSRGFTRSSGVSAECSLGKNQQLYSGGVKQHLDQVIKIHIRNEGQMDITHRSRDAWRRTWH